MRRAISRILEKLRLIRPTFALRFLAARWRPSVVWRNLRYSRHRSPGEIPLPSTSARMLVAGSADIGWFVDGGRLAAQSIREAVTRAGRDIDRLERILDFGCGCGRVLRHWVGLRRARLYGTDSQLGLLLECRRLLPSVRVTVNGPEPPLPFADESFDLVYCLSVFTHLDERQQLLWRDEIRRVLKPGGLWLLTTQGLPYMRKLSRAEQTRFQSGDVVCQRREFRGLNLCQTFHPEPYVRGVLSEGLTVVDYQCEGARGNPTQDLYVLRRNPVGAPTARPVPALMEA